MSSSWTWLSLGNKGGTPRAFIQRNEMKWHCHCVTLQLPLVRPKTMSISFKQINNIPKDISTLSIMKLQVFSTFLNSAIRPNFYYFTVFVNVDINRSSQSFVLHLVMRGWLVGWILVHPLSRFGTTN